MSDEAPAHRSALIRQLELRIFGKGELAFPCLPSMLDVYVDRLATLFGLVGKPSSSEEVAALRTTLASGLAQGFTASPYSTLVVTYEVKPPPRQGVSYVVTVTAHSIEELYSHIAAVRAPPLFGSHPDAKVMALAESLGAAQDAPVLDVGAGSGRNAVPLARRGHPTDALEPVFALCEQMRADAARGHVPLRVIQADLLGDELVLEPERYRLVVLAEVVPHFADVEELRFAMNRLARSTASGGLIVLSTFLPKEGYEPDALTREASAYLWSCVFSRGDWSFMTEELPFDLASDESVHDYEQAHLPPGAFPPTGWFVDWSKGRDVFPVVSPPVELRWLVFTKH